MDYPARMKADLTLDARGLLCPLPVLKLRKCLKSLEIGAVLELWADDPAAVIDVQHYCSESGHDFLGMDEQDGYTAYRVRKSG